MIRQFFFSEEHGRNTIWLMLSGFFLKIGAKENFYGQIVMPENHYLFNLDKKNFNNDYLKFDNLHYIILDGPVEHLNDNRIKEIKKKNINIYYVGRFNNYWKNIKNSQPLFTENNIELQSIFIQIEKKFPIFFKKYFLKRLTTTIFATKNIKLFINHIIKKEKYVYYGYIKPTQKHINFLNHFLNLGNHEINSFFEENKNFNNLQKKIKEICTLKENLLNKIKNLHYPYLNELLLFLIRNTLCNFLKGKKSFFIYDGAGGDLNFNAYEIFFGNQHTYIDLGSKVGYDKIYPRSALLSLSQRKTVNFFCEEDFFLLNKNNSNLYLQNKIDNFFKTIL
jgi:hypothetical protein